jgi:hypothetical protein
VFGWVTRETGAAAREQGESSLQTSLPLQEENISPAREPILTGLCSLYIVVL